MYQRDTQIDQLSASLQGSQNRVQKLEQDIDSLGGDLERMRKADRCANDATADDAHGHFLFLPKRQRADSGGGKTAGAL